MDLINGKKIGGEILQEIKQKISQLSSRKPGLAFIIVGNDPASHTYVQMKKNACAYVGIESTVIALDEKTEEHELLFTIEKCNQNTSLDGILVQFPLPSHLSQQRAAFQIDPKKDVDGFHPLNMGKLLLGEEDGFFPCTPKGIEVLLEKSQIPTQGKHVVIVGRSNVVGKPLAALLVQKRPSCDATVTIAHNVSENLPSITRSADILISAVGQANFITKEMVRPKSVVIDVGINRLDGKIVGDVDFAHVAPLTSAITPVPGGVGPMTIAILMQNTLQSYKQKMGL